MKALQQYANQAGQAAMSSMADLTAPNTPVPANEAPAPAAMLAAPNRIGFAALFSVLLGVAILATAWAIGEATGESLFRKLDSVI